MNRSIGKSPPGRVGLREADLLGPFATSRGLSFFGTFDFLPPLLTDGGQTSQFIRFSPPPFAIDLGSIHSGIWGESTNFFPTIRAGEGRGQTGTVNYPTFSLQGGGGSTEGSFAPRALPRDKLEITPHGAIIYRMNSGKSIVFRPPTSGVKDLQDQGNIALFVLGDEPIVDILDGRSRAEQEGLLYFYFFMVSGMTQQTPIALSSHVMKHAETIMRHSYTGPPPEWLIDSEIAPYYPDGTDSPAFAHLIEEMRHWSSFGLDRLLKYRVFDSSGRLEMKEDGVTLINRGYGRYSIYEDNKYIGDVDLRSYPLPSLSDGVERIELDEDLQRLRYKILFEGMPALIPISSGNLFSKEETSGHLLFQNGRAVAIDPPVDIIEWCKVNRIPLDLIDQVILTHVHADHVAGLIRMISHSPHPVMLSTLPIIERQFVEIYHAMALGSLSREYIRNLWISEPVNLQKPWVAFNGMELSFNLTFHTIPALGYILYSRSDIKSAPRPVVSYSGDSQIDPAVVWPLVGRRDQKTGRVIMTAARSLTVMLSPLLGIMAGGYALIDAGSAIIHTKPDYLADLLSIFGIDKSRLLAYHGAQETIEGAGLRYAGGGLPNTISLAELFNWSPPDKGLIDNGIVTEAVFRDPLLSELPDHSIRSLIEGSTVVEVANGKEIIQIGEAGDVMYLVADGEVGIYMPDDSGVLKLLKIRRAGMFGETAILREGQARTATVKAEEDTTLVSIPGVIARRVFAESNLTDRLAHLSKVRFDADPVISSSSLFSGFSIVELDAIYLVGIIRLYNKGEKIYTVGSEADGAYIILDGVVDITFENGNGDSRVQIGSGDIFGEMAMISRSERSATAEVTSDKLSVLFLPAEKLAKLLENPHIRSRFLAVAVERAVANRPNGD